jgi:oligoribonuclease NrnB/cAMP/cGMP phosphodiesterase (DHH superfamily)
MDKQYIDNYDTIIYHTMCSDGISALWCANYYKKINEIIACKAGSNPNFNPNNKLILFVDICPSFEYLLDISKTSKFILILDHHKSALDLYNKNINNIPSNVMFNLDMNRSGCQITWDYFFPNENSSTTRPWFIDYVGDRDLWLWKLPNSKAINASLFDNEYFNPKNLDKLNELINPSTDLINKLKIYGDVLLKNQQKELDNSAYRAVEATITLNNKTWNIWLGNTISSLRSELGNVLANKKLSNGNLPDFSATWVYDVKSNEWWISFRGIDSSPDLSEIAGYFGGGGHKKASGITIKDGKHLRDFFTIK